MSTYRFPKVNEVRPQVADIAFYGDIQFDPNADAPIYIGFHVTKGESDSSTDWKVLKFTYSGSAITRIQTAYGSWSGRAALFA
jgi:hypothetical protein